jgi:2-isopropylmalate synthase
MKSDRILIFDTTLRDGEQSPGASLTSSEKLVVASQLALLGVDAIEAGFPAASEDDLEAVRRIAQEVGTEDGPIICGLARCHMPDIEKAWEAVRHAAKPRIHTFLATSDIHLKHKLKMTREEVVSRVRNIVSQASALCPDIEFSPEDAGRSDIDFLVQVLTAAIESGAKTLNIPDTVGYTTPDEYGALISTLIEKTPGSDKVVWSVHCHDDLGLATANALSGLKAGARQAEVTINGIGERAGNTSLEEIVMTLRTRYSHYRLDTDIDATQITRTSKMVSNYTGIPVQPNKAIVGANAFSHEAGIHQDGVLKYQATYEIMTPEAVGLSTSNLVLGKHSGRHAFRVRLEEMGHRLSQEELERAFVQFKRIAERKKSVTDHDLEAIVADECSPEEEVYQLECLQVACGQPGMPTATLKLQDPSGHTHIKCSIGTGPVDAIYRAVDSIIGERVELLEFRVNAITEGIDALGEVTVRIQSAEDDSRTFGGHGSDTDILVACCKAYLAALNKVLTHNKQRRKSPTENPAMELVTA